MNEREAKTATCKAKLQATLDRLAQDREAIAAEAINTLGELLLPHLPAPYRVMIQKL